MNRPCSSSLKNKFVWMAFSFCLIAVLFFGTAHAEASQTAGSKDLISKNQAAEIARIFSELDEEYESQILSAKTFDERPWYVVDFIKFDLDGNGIREKRVVVSALDGHIETSDEVLRELRARSGDYSMNVTRPAGVQKTQKSKPQPKFSAPSFSNRNTRPQFQIPFGLFGGPVFWVMIGVVLIGIFQAAKRFLLKPKSQHGSVPAAAVPNIFSSGGQSATITRVVSANIVEVHLPKDLPTFKNVGGMESVKKEIRDSIGLVLEKKELAKRYGIQFNGILFYGPPGTGKSFIVKATAGEYNMNLIHLKSTDLISSFVGGSAEKIEQIFRAAIKHRPCLLFFDEFESVAADRKQENVTENSRIVAALLRWLEEIRRYHGEVMVCAATNYKNSIDAAVIRSGRFDKHIQIPLPDEGAREQVLKIRLMGKPVSQLDLAPVVAKTEGMSAAEIAGMLDQAFLKVFNEKLHEGGNMKLDQDELLAAVDNARGKTRASGVKKLAWDDLILQDEVKQDLRRLVALIQNPDLSLKSGAEIPKGVLLFGPPGTGKTTIARVLASEANASFFVISQSDIYSKWYGDTQQNIQKIFEEARKQKPSIIFIDEIDAVLPVRSEGGTDQLMNQATSMILQEIDGIQDSSGVFILGATNFPKGVDPAALRGGRLSAQIEIPLPDNSERLKLFQLFMRKAKLDPSINWQEFVDLTPGYNGADIKEICNRAILDSIPQDSSGEIRTLTQEDLRQGIQQYRKKAGVYEVPPEFKKSKLGF